MNGIPTYEPYDMVANDDKSQVPGSMHGRMVTTRATGQVMRWWQPLGR